MSSKCPADHAPADLINLVLRLTLLAGVVIEDYGPVLLSAVHALAVRLAKRNENMQSASCFVHLSTLKNSAIFCPKFFRFPRNTTE